MATADYIISNQSGASFRTDLNNTLAAIVSNNSNSSQPATRYAYQWWADTSAGVMKIRNSANDGWIELFQLDGTLTLEDGSQSAPALAFRDDLDTGIFSSGANTFNVACGGVEMLELGNTTIFNESGADVDFRIEGDTEQNLFYVDAGNNRIGVGISTPQVLMHLNGSNARFQLTDSTTGTASGDGVIMGLDGSQDFFINNRESSKNIKFFTTNQEHMRLESDGDLRLSSDNANINYGFIDGWADSKGQMVIGSDHGTTGTGSNNSDIIFKTRGGERLRISHGGGITFNGDTAADNRLDDYEEGSWTPSISFGGGTTGLSVSLQSGHYTKIGNLVYIKAHFLITNVGSSTGHARITGLPFTTTATPSSFTPIADRGAVNLGNVSSNAVGMAMFLAGSSSPFLYGYKFNGEGNFGVQHNAFGTNSEIDINFVYRTS